MVPVLSALFWVVVLYGHAVPYSTADGFQCWWTLSGRHGVFTTGSVPCFLRCTCVLHQHLHTDGPVLGTKQHTLVRTLLL